MGNSRYTIGIDLGTTNSALAYVDTLVGSESTQLVLPQFAELGVVEDRCALPSCCYLAIPAELRRGYTNYPWGGEAPSTVGLFAFKQLGNSSGRVIQSAKSWLSFAEVDRTAKILPWGNTDIPEAEKLSPIDVSSYYLTYMRDAWNNAFAKENKSYSFEKQDIVITVPASFDETAQRLTLEAAYKAGFPENTRLLEEPQAAFYRYLQLNKLNDFNGTVLVCDTGGGTTDFSLFYVKQTSNTLPEITRLSVSNHLLLGGDNIDLTIAHILAGRLKTEKLSYKQRSELVYQSRILKERILSNADSNEDDETFTVSIAGSGSSLFASALSATINKNELKDILLNGFFPECDLNTELESRPQGLQEFGLRYATDSAVTRHLANFIRQSGSQKIDAVLFNGGSLKPKFLQERLIKIISNWGEPPQLLDNNEMDFAVSLGAAHYAEIMRTKTGKIKGGYPRSIYIELESADKNRLLCVVPKGFEEGERAAITEHKLKLIVGRPVRFNIYNSITRKNDKLGELLELNAKDFNPLSPMQTIVDVKGEEIAVSIESELSATGMLQLFCINEAGERVGKLEFNLRGDEKKAEGQLENNVDEKKLKAAEELILRYYGKADKNETAKPKALIKELEKVLHQEKSEWELPFLRALWPVLEKGMTKKNRSSQHEAAWLNLAGFALRPGYGAELDSFRIKELLRLLDLKLSYPKDAAVQVQWALLWRRVAGGLNREEQTKIAAEFFKQLGNSDNPELYWLLASLERIPEEQRIKVGSALVRKIQRTKGQFIQPFALLAAREPLYGEVNCAVPAKYVATWFDTLATLDWKAPQYQNLCYAFLQAGRVTNDPSRDLDETYREKISSKIFSVKRDIEFTKPLKEFIKTELQDKQTLMGEALPLGFTLC